MTAPRPNGVRIQVRLTPKGGKDAIDGWLTISPETKYLKARVRTAPEDGKANAALIALLSKRLQVPKSAVRIASGATSRLKMIEIEGDSADLSARLANIGKAE
jgi:uncharacterized protein